MAWRSLVRRPALMIVAAMTAALGIGPSTAVFSFVDALLLRPVPFPEPERLVHIYSMWEGTKHRLSLREIDDIREHTRVFVEVAGFSDGGRYNLASDVPEDLPATFSTFNLFSTLGVSPIIGSTWTVSEDRSRSFDILISNGLWKRRFDADPGIVGKQIRLVDMAYTVRGVLPEGFQFPAQSDIYRCFGLSANPASYQNRSARNAGVVARLRPGATIEAAQAELDGLSMRLADDHPKTNHGLRFYAEPLREIYTTQARTPLRILGLGSLLVFLVAVANLANILLIRGLERRPATALIVALGATHWSVLRQSIVECIAIATAGGALGTILAHVMVQAASSLIQWTLPPWMEVRIDLRVMAFLVASLIAMSLAASIAPWLQSLSVRPAEVLREASKGSGAKSLARSILVGTQVAFATVLLIGAWILCESAWRLHRVDMGFDASGLLTFRTTLPWQTYGRDGVIRFHDRAVESLASLPGVEAAFVSSDLPISERGVPINPIQVEGQTPAAQDANPRVWMQSVGVGYHSGMRIPLRRGRYFGMPDSADADPVAIVSENLADRLWPGQDAVGKRIRPWPSIDGSPWLTVVGVVGAIRPAGPASEPAYHIYTCSRQLTGAGAYFILRGRTDARGLALMSAKAISSIDPLQAISAPETMERRISKLLWQNEVAAVLILIFAVLSLGLSIVGVYGTLACHVAERNQEFGIRSALGATASDLVWLVQLRCACLAIAGGLLGSLVCFSLLRVFGQDLLQTELHGGGAYVAAPLVSLAAASVAGWVPSRRAARSDAAQLLRH
ncbi:MAG: ABC transporter permease [Bryobacteraceae bacterium]